MKLKEMKVRQQACIIGYEKEEGEYFRRLLSLGLTPGQIITVCRIQPFGGPLQVDVGGSSLAIRSYEADLLKLSPIENTSKDASNHA